MISEDSDGTAHLRSLIWVFVEHIPLLYETIYEKRNKQRTMTCWKGAQANSRFCLSHWFNCRSCRPAYYLVIKRGKREDYPLNMVSSYYPFFLSSFFGVSSSVISVVIVIF